MFSMNEKKIIASVIEQTLLTLNHPEMPKEKPEFTLHVKGKDTWSWADIEPNHHYGAKNTNPNPWNEVARDVLEDKND